MSRTFFALSCLAASAAAGTLAFSAPAAARTVTVAVSASFTSLDPYDAPDILTRLASKSFYEGLFTFNSKMEPVPELAEGYETSPDAKVWTVTLKKGVKFHDGSEFTADAVKANFDRLLNPDNKLSRYNVYKFIEKVEVLDPYKVRFTLQAPLATFVRRLAMTNPQMICPSLLKDAHGLEGKKVTAFNACGTGPYTLVSFNPAEELVVKKNPNYRDPSLPKLDGIVWKPVVENSTRAAMLHTGEAQFVFPMPNEQIAQFKGDPKFRIEEVPSIMQRYLSINTTVKPFDDVRVRQAINYAINKEALCKVAFAGYAVPSATIYPAEIPGALKLGPWPYDPKKARELLKEAGYPNGFKTTLWSAFNNTTAVKTMQFVQQQLAQVGIKAEARALEAGQRVQVYGNKDPKKAPNRLYIIGWSNSTVDPDWGMRPALYSKNQPPVLNNEAYYQNPKVDALLDQALADTDPAKRAAEYKELQEMVWQDAPWAFLVFEDVTSAANKHLKNFNTLADGSFEFYSAEWQED
mgnify:CR=1 FL=1